MVTIRDIDGGHDMSNRSIATVLVRGDVWEDKVCMCERERYQDIKATTTIDDNLWFSIFSLSLYKKCAFLLRTYVLPEPRTWSGPLNQSVERVYRRRTVVQSHRYLES